MPIPTFESSFSAEAHAHPSQPETPTPTQTPTGVFERIRRHRARRTHQPFEFPQELLDQISTAHDRANQEDPEGHVYVSTHSILRAFAEPIFLILGVFTTLQRANEAAMNYFRNHHGAFFRDEGRLDRWNLFWIGGGTNSNHRVRWNADDGRLCLYTSNSEGDKFVVEVQARVLDDTGSWEMT